MNLSANAQATLLLTSDFSRAAASEYKPLSNSEWGKFALWLKHQRISPADLLVPQPQEKLTGWSDRRFMDLNPRRCRLSRSLEKPIANGCTSRFIWLRE